MSASERLLIKPDSTHKRMHQVARKGAGQFKRRRIQAPERVLQTVLIDNFDSYTYNLYQLLAEVNGGELFPESTCRAASLLQPRKQSILKALPAWESLHSPNYCPMCCEASAVGRPGNSLRQTTVTFTMPVTEFSNHAAAPTVVRNTDLSWRELSQRLLRGAYDNVVISPGPGTPLRAADVGKKRTLVLHKHPTSLVPSLRIITSL